NPFNIDAPGVVIIDTKPEAEAAGVHTGDTLRNFAGQPYRGATDFYVFMQAAHPGDRLAVEVQAPDGVAQKATIELRPYRDEFPITFSEGAQEIIAAIMPLFCVLLGFWVAG